MKSKKLRKYLVCIFIVFIGLADSRVFSAPSPNDLDLTCGYESSNVLIVLNEDSPYQDDSNRYKEWTTLSPREKLKLREKMQMYRSMPVERQNLLRHRYEEWKKLPPEDQDILKKKLEQWEELTPEEKESIKQRFKR